MKSIQQIKEEIATLKAEAEAICQLADEEGRDLTAEEQKGYVALVGVGAKGDDSFQAGKLHALQDQLSTAERREQLAKASLQNKINAGDVKVPGSSDSDSVFGNVRVPRSSANPHRLRGFEGADAAKDAYGSAQFVAAFLGNETSQQWCQDHGIEFRALHKEGTDNLGGVFVPEPLEAAIIRLVEAHGVFRMYAGRKVMSAPTDTVGRRLGGLRVYYPEEGAALTKSDMRFDKITLTAKKYAVLTELSTELNEDALIDMISLLVDEVAKAKALAEDTNGFLGDGTGTYAGVTGVHAAINAVSGTPSKVTASAIALSSLTLSDFAKLEAALPEFTGMEPAWYCHKSVWGTAMAPLMRAAGGNTMSNIAGRAEREFMGYPVRVTNALHKTPTANQPICFFGDLSMSSTLGTRRGMSFAQSREGDHFTNDTIGLKCTQRIAIQNHDVGQAALAASGDQMAVAAMAGPILSLVAPAS